MSKYWNAVNCLGRSCNIRQFRWVLFIQWLYIYAYIPCQKENGTAPAGGTPPPGSLPAGPCRFSVRAGQGLRHRNRNQDREGDPRRPL